MFAAVTENIALVNQEKHVSHAGIITVELSRVQHEDGGAAVFVRILKAEHLFDVKNTIVSTNLSDDKSSLRIRNL